jgi:hypothetical protein
MRFSISYASMTSAFGELARPRTGSREATDGPGGSGYADRPARFTARRLGVSSTAQASRMRGRQQAAANHFQHVSASTAQSLLPAKGRRCARVPAVISSPLWGVSHVALRAFWLRGGRVVIGRSPGGARFEGSG